MTASASLSTDAGHDAADGAKWAHRQPEKIIDFAHRANHVGAIATKAIVSDYYNSPAKRSYFFGCSNGGRDALMLASALPGGLRRDRLGRAGEQLDRTDVLLRAQWCGGAPFAGR